VGRDFQGLRNLSEGKVFPELEVEHCALVLGKIMQRCLNGEPEGVVIAWKKRGEKSGGLRGKRPFISGSCNGTAREIAECVVCGAQEKASRIPRFFKKRRGSR